MFYSPFETKSHYIAHTDLMLTVLPLPGSPSNSALTLPFLILGMEPKASMCTESQPSFLLILKQSH